MRPWICRWTTTTDGRDGRTEDDDDDGTDDGRTEDRTEDDDDDGTDDGRRRRATDDGRRRRTDEKIMFFYVILAHVLTTKPHLSIQNMLWDHPHGGKPYEESFFNTLKPPKHRFILVFCALRLIF